MNGGPRAALQIARRTVLPRRPSASPMRCRFHATSPTLSIPSAFADIERVKLAYNLHEPPGGSSRNNTEQGKSSAIIFMHGLFGCKKNNRTVSKALARTLARPIYCIDLRNHGDSPHATRHDYPSMAADVAGFIADHDLGAPTLIGHSMGAKTAMTLALASPDLVSSIVAADNAPVDAALGTDFAKYVRGMRRIEEAGVTRQAQADKILAEYEEALPIRQFLLGNLHRTGGETLKFRFALDVLAKSLDNNGDFPYKDPEAVRFGKPALFVRGTHSKYVSDETMPVIGRFFPCFQLVDVEAGHWLISEKPEEFMKAVTEFLEPGE